MRLYMNSYLVVILYKVEFREDFSVSNKVKVFLSPPRLDFRQNAWRRSVYFLLCQHHSCINVHSTNTYQIPLQLRGMDSAAQNYRSSARPTKKTWKLREQDEFTPITLEPLPEAAKPVISQPIPHFEPQSRIPFDSMRCKVPIGDPL
jgi:hypothetical protein